jgi:hypothetical protein
MGGRQAVSRFSSENKEISNGQTEENYLSSRVGTVDHRRRFLNGGMFTVDLQLLKQYISVKHHPLSGKRNP